MAVKQELFEELFTDFEKAIKTIERAKNQVIKVHRTAESIFLHSEIDTSSYEKLNKDC